MPEERLCITARDTFGLSPTKTTRGGLTDVRKSKATPVIKMIYTIYCSVQKPKAAVHSFHFLVIMSYLCRNNKCS